MPADELGAAHDALPGRKDGCETATGTRRHAYLNRQDRRRPAVVRMLARRPDSDQLGLDHLKTGLMVQKPMPARDPGQIDLCA